MWTAEVVQARFMEAADIERRLRVKGGPSAGNAWPAYGFDEEDRKGWTQADIDAEKDRWARNAALSTPEIARWEECYFSWTLDEIARPIDRMTVWGYVRCAIHGRSFSKFCKDRGWVRRTAYARLERTFENLAQKFLNTGLLFTPPDDKWLAQDGAAAASTGPTMDEAAADEPRKTVHPPYRAERHHDALTTPEAIAAFEQHLVEVNEQRRKARRRKALRGVPGEDLAETASTPPLVDA
jgi:hypothetical protein